MSLTSACVVHSNVDDLENLRCIRYLAVVDPIHSTFSAVHTYHHTTSTSVEIPIVASIGNSGSIGVDPAS